MAPEPEAVRPADAADRDGIMALLCACFGAEEAALAHPWLTGPDAASADWCVAVAGPDIVATSARLSKQWFVDEVALSVAQIEFVATAPSHRGQGLVRRQFDHHGNRATVAGQLVRVVNGIPYFYRRFGFGYGLSYPPLFALGHTVATDRSRPPVTVRAGMHDDTDALVGFERERETAADIGTEMEATVRRRIWSAERSAVESPGTERVLVAERAGEVVGWAALQRRVDDGRIYLLPLRADGDETADALLDAATAIAATERLPLIAHDSGDAGAARRLRARSTNLGIEHGIYVAMPAAVDVLRALRPVLDRRLAASPFASSSGSVIISRFHDAVRIDHADGVITAIEPAPAVPDPYGEGVCGVAPDWFPALVLGRWGAVELARRADDVVLGDQAHLLAVLFPAMTADVAVDF